MCNGGVGDWKRAAWQAWRHVDSRRRPHHRLGCASSRLALACHRGNAAGPHGQRLPQPLGAQPGASPVLGGGLSPWRRGSVCRAAQGRQVPCDVTSPEALSSFAGFASRALFAIRISSASLVNCTNGSRVSSVLVAASETTVSKSEVDHHSRSRATGLLHHSSLSELIRQLFLLSLLHEGRGSGLAYGGDTMCAISTVDHLLCTIFTCFRRDWYWHVHSFRRVLAAKASYCS
mmetsp:Transcript_33279/g.73093  ORF Transcript_33279/g.73093 Transcript_33279/m.73093 type:complete len:232 (-) Transcript_33279:234-929(-)